MLHGTLSYPALVDQIAKESEQWGVTVIVGPPGKAVDRVTIEGRKVELTPVLNDCTEPVSKDVGINVQDRWGDSAV